MEKCERCGEYKQDVYRRAEHGKRVCNDCHRDILRNGSPTGLVRRPVHLVMEDEADDAQRFAGNTD